MGTLKAIQTSTLRARAVEAIRAGIITGEIPPGTPLVETRLAETLAVSRGTIREALLELTQEHVVVSDSQGRLRAAELDSETVRQLFEVRACLEALAITLIARSPERAAKQAVLRNQLALFTENRDSVMQLIEVDVKFHESMCELAENSFLLSSWRALAGPLRMAIMHGGRERALRNITRAKHEPFVEALNDGVEEPSAIVYATLEATLESLMQASADAPGAEIEKEEA